MPDSSFSRKLLVVKLQKSHWDLGYTGREEESLDSLVRIPVGTKGGQGEDASVMGCNRRVSSHKSVVFTGLVDHFGKLEQNEISHANFVTVEEVFAAKVIDNFGSRSGELLNKLVAVTRAEHAGANSVSENFCDNLLHHDDVCAILWGRSHKCGTPSVTDIGTDSL